MNSCCSWITAYFIFLMVMKYSCSPSLADFRLHPHSSAKQRLLLPLYQLLVTGMLVGEIYDMQVKWCVHMCQKYVADVTHKCRYLKYFWIGYQYFVSACAILPQMQDLLRVMPFFDTVFGFCSKSSLFVHIFVFFFFTNFSCFVAIFRYLRHICI